jgi:ABC-type nitrate/sulfonate/bicarbonate transport system permease component
MNDIVWFGIGVVVLTALLLVFFPVLVTCKTVVDRLERVSYKLRESANNLKRWR